MTIDKYDQMRPGHLAEMEKAMEIAKNSPVTEVQEMRCMVCNVGVSELDTVACGIPECPLRDAYNAEMAREHGPDLNRER